MLRCLVALIPSQFQLKGPNEDSCPKIRWGVGRVGMKYRGAKGLTSGVGGVRTTRMGMTFDVALAASAALSLPLACRKGARSDRWMKVVASALLHGMPPPAFRCHLE